MSQFDSINLDKVYAKPLSNIKAFEFDETVAKVFPDMIKRSVPGYGEIITMTGVLASIYAKDNSHIYDLGCSLGASSLAALQYIKDDVSLICIDDSLAMVKACKQNLSVVDPSIKYSVKQQNLLKTEIENASVVILNFVLQFIQTDIRDQVLQTIWRGLNPNGVLLIAEKIKFDNNAIQDTMKKWHTKFKQKNGYTDLEIAQKRTALENVLISDTESDLKNRLKNAGFSEVQQWFQALNFKAFVAFK